MTIYRNRSTEPRQTGPIASIAAIDVQPASVQRARIRLAEAPDVDAVTELLSEAAAWTAAIGFANWPSPFPREVVTDGLARRELYVAEVGSDVDPTIVATLTLQWSDELFWGAQPDDAGYVHRLVVRRDRAGAGLGAALIDWATEQVQAAGRTRLRLDVSADNLPLSSLYERLGFTHRGVREGELVEPGGGIRRWKTRLYERDCNEENPR
jgi:ribosomal protein S18 acetylase RimI-like enzyme